MPLVKKKEFIEQSGGGCHEMHLQGTNFKASVRKMNEKWPSAKQRHVHVFVSWFILFLFQEGHTLHSREGIKRRTERRQRGTQGEHAPELRRISAQEGSMRSFLVEEGTTRVLSLLP